MAKDKYYGKTLRKNFARHEEVMAMPNLLEIQKKSYQWFLDTGLREVFADVASIVDYAGNLELSFIDYSMDEKPKYDVEECKARDATYAAPMKVLVRLHNKETGEIKENEIFMGDFPLMTHGGTFVINGAERVVVSQIVRSPGIYYGKEIDLKTDLPLLTSTVIPYRGAWLEYETDTSEVFWVRIDKNRKLPITCLIRALGLKTDAEILERFGDDRRIVATLEKDTCKTYEEAMLEIYRKLRPGEPPTLDSAETLLQNLFFDPRRYDLSTVGRYKFNKKLTFWTRAKGQKLAMPVADPATGEILFEDGHVLTADDCTLMDTVGVPEVSVTLDSGDTIRIFTNKMCDMRHYVDFDPRELCGIKERVRFDVLQELLGKYSGDELVYNATLGDWRTHNGVDAAAAAGDEVPAVKGGRVSVVEDDALWGGVVEIVDATGCTWRYCGVTPGCVVGGDVAAGDVIVVVAAIPAEADLASHVHLECLKDGTWMKPEI